MEVENSKQPKNESNQVQPEAEEVPDNNEVEEEMESIVNEDDE